MEVQLKRPRGRVLKDCGEEWLVRTQDEAGHFYPTLWPKSECTVLWSPPWLWLGVALGLAVLIGLMAWYRI